MRDLLARKVGVESTGRIVGIISATGINDLLNRLDLIEKKDKLVGILSSSAIALVLFLVLLFWFANNGLVMGIEEPEWKTIGLIIQEQILETMCKAALRSTILRIQVLRQPIDLTQLPRPAMLLPQQLPRRRAIPRPPMARLPRRMKPRL